MARLYKVILEATSEQMLDLLDMKVTIVEADRIDDGEASLNPGQKKEAMQTREVMLSSLTSLNPVAQKKTEQHRYVNGKRGKGITAQGLILKLLNKKRHHFHELQAAMVAVGFAPTSTVPPLVRLRQAGKIKKIGEDAIERSVFALIRK